MERERCAHLVGSFPIRFGLDAACRARCGHASACTTLIVRVTRVREQEGGEKGAVGLVERMGGTCKGLGGGPGRGWVEMRV